jgi:hypothetical protein
VVESVLNAFLLPNFIGFDFFSFVCFLAAKSFAGKIFSETHGIKSPAMTPYRCPWLHQTFAGAS